MGTRADFYIGRGAKAKWIGSIAWDGYPDGLPKALKTAKTKAAFCRVVKALGKRDDWTAPEQGWPWPWDDSCTTDYAYAFDGERVWASSFGGKWFKANGKEPDGRSTKTAVFPNMKDRSNLTLGKRSGIMLIGI